MTKASTFTEATASPTASKRSYDLGSMKAAPPRRTTVKVPPGAKGSSCLRGTMSLARFSTATAQRRATSGARRSPRRSAFVDTASRRERCLPGSTAGPVGEAGASTAAGADAPEGGGDCAFPRNHQRPPAAPATMPRPTSTSGTALGLRIEVFGLSDSIGALPGIVR